jgi:molybdate transport system ATP-binding protein
MTIAVDIKHRLGAVLLDAHFEAAGGLVALFGRSGSGKTSIVNVIAGLIRPDEGRVVVDGVTLVDTGRGIFLPRHKRRVGYVFQEARLFPHLTVRQNLLYGRWFAPATEAAATLDDVVNLLGLQKLLDRRPARLSGGEKQRVAIGRALLAKPRVLLMDEPLASLDERHKQEILPYIERLRDRHRVPIVYVSHSMAEVARLATEVVLIADGRIVAVGPTVEIMQRLDLQPLSGRADAGALIEATVESHDQGHELTLLRSRGGLWRVPKVDADVGSRLRMRVRARDVMLAMSEPKDVSALNVLKGVVAAVGPGNGPSVEVRIDCSGEALLARLTRYSVEHLSIGQGQSVFALIKSVAIDRGNINAAMAGDQSTADAEMNGG